MNMKIISYYKKQTIAVGEHGENFKHGYFK